MPNKVGRMVRLIILIHVMSPRTEVTSMMLKVVDGDDEPEDGGDSEVLCCCSSRSLVGNERRFRRGKKVEAMLFAH